MNEIFIFIVAIVFIGIALIKSERYWAVKNSFKKIIVENAELQQEQYFLIQNELKTRQAVKIAAHDLIGPLSGILSAVNIVLENENLYSEERQILLLVQSTSMRSIEMVKDILNTENVDGCLEKKPHDMKKLLRSCIDAMQYKAAEKQQKIFIEQQNDIEESVVINVNKGKIWRVINNLTINALKFSPMESIVYVRWYKDIDNICIAIEDCGIGISDDLSDHIFDVYTEAKRPDTTGKLSSGLGLSICKQIVEAHNGKIWFENNIDVGATFYVSLPID